MSTDNVPLFNSILRDFDLEPMCVTWGLSWGCRIWASRIYRDACYNLGDHFFQLIDTVIPFLEETRFVHASLLAIADLVIACVGCC